MRLRLLVQEAGFISLPVGHTEENAPFGRLGGLRSRCHCVGSLAGESFAAVPLEEVDGECPGQGNVGETRGLYVGGGEDQVRLQGVA